MEIVNIHQAKTHLSKLLLRVQDGEEIIIAKSGKPCARLVPVDQPAQRIPGIAKGKVTEAFFEPLPDDQLDAWE